ncbi:MAG TPA: DUF3108 domain-containing protein [Methylotenera sp.]|nr:DUF3108 domain-containing protein [Methylotenera sp.]
MFNHIKIFTLLNLSVLLSATSATSVMAEQAVRSNAALPKSIHAVYEVTKDGQPFANVHEQFVVNGNSYQLESVTKGIGVYALFGERVLNSSGKVTAQGLKPDHFELRQGGNPKKTLLADFDWEKQNLRMTVKGKPRDEALAAGTQDLASFAYQFMYMPQPLKGDIAVTLTTGKKLKQYQYAINPKSEKISSAGAQYKTLHLKPSAQDNEESKELWLAADYHYLPVRILMVDDSGQKLEQTLTELKVE